MNHNKRTPHNKDNLKHQSDKDKTTSTLPTHNQTSEMHSDEKEEVIKKIKKTVKEIVL